MRLPRADALGGAEREVESGDGMGDLRFNGTFLALDPEHLTVPFIGPRPAVSVPMRVPHALRKGGLQRARGQPSCSPTRVLDHPEYSEEMLLSHAGSGFDADSVAQTCEALADESTWWCSGFGVIPSQCGSMLRRSIGLHDRAIRYLMPLPEVVRLVDFVIVIRSHFALSTDALTPANRLGYKPAGRAIMPGWPSGARGVSRGILCFCFEIQDEASRVSCPGERCDIGTEVAWRSVKPGLTL